MGFRFFAVPGHRLGGSDQPLVHDEFIEPELPTANEVIERALIGAEFKDMRCRDRLRSLLAADNTARHGSPGKGYGSSAVFARPPQELPALLRLADQLERLAEVEGGERALVWRCGECKARYAVPVALARSVSIRCERCGQTVDLFAEKSIGEEALLDPFSDAVNGARRQLAGFFRDAMARGWSVLVSSTE